METFLKADIFFVVTTIAFILLAIVAVVAVIYLILILRQVAKLMRRIRSEGEAIADDVRAVREGVETSGEKVRDAISWMGRILLRILVPGRRDDNER